MRSRVPALATAAALLGLFMTPAQQTRLQDYLNSRDPHSAHAA